MQDKRYLSFEIDDKNVKIRNILNQDFLELELWMIADHEPNNNNSHFELEAMKDAIPTIYNKPILGSFTKLHGEQDGDFGGHDSEYTTDQEIEADYFDNSGPYQEVPLGLITESSKVEIVEGPDGANWLKTNGFLWVKYCTPQVLSLLRRHKGRCKISVEVEVLESKEDEETGIEHIKKFNFLAVTILGSYPVGNGIMGMRQEIHEGIEGANLKVLNFSKNPKFQEQLKQLMFACKQLEESMNVNNTNFNDSKDTQTQNKNKTEKVDNSVPKEGSDIYHPIPQNVENEEVPEIGYSEDDDEPKEETEKSTNSRKDEKSQMNFSLSYNTRRELLDSALHEAVHGMYAGDNIWCYVNDFDETICYFYLEVEGSECGDWCAPYTLTLGNQNGEEKVIDCTVDLNQKERVVREWKKLSQDESSETEGKTDMKDDKNFTEDEKQTEAQNYADDRGTEAGKSGDARGVPASKSGDARGVPHSPATYEDDENKDDSKDEKKENESCGDKENESKDDKSEECKMSDDSKEECSEDNKECESKDDKEECSKDDSKEECSKDDNKETEAKDVTEVKSVPAGGKKVTKVPSKSVSSEDDSDDGDKCDCSKDDKEDECNYEAKFAQLSADYVAMQKENETLKAVNAKFEADIADLMAKVSKFEAEKNEAVNANLFNFAKSMIDSEADLSEDTRKAMSAEVETECKASKFSSEDEVKKFTVTKIAMALYEARQAQKATMSNNTSKKEEFVQTIVAPGSVNQKVEDALTAKRKALEALE